MKHIVSFSGGKDSTAMLIMMIEKGMQIDEIVFAEDLRGSFYVYPEDEEYVPDMFDPDSGVEIITDAYEKRIEDRL